MRRLGETARRLARGARTVALELVGLAGDIALHLAKAIGLLALVAVAYAVSVLVAGGTVRLPWWP